MSAAQTIPAAPSVRTLGATIAAAAIVATVAGALALTQLVTPAQVEPAPAPPVVTHPDPFEQASDTHVAPAVNDRGGSELMRFHR